MTTEVYRGGRERKVEQFDNTTTTRAHKNTSVDGQYNVRVATHFSVSHGESQLFLANKLSAKFQDRVEFKVGANLVALAHDGTVTLSADKELVLRCGAASLVLKRDGTIEASGRTKIALSSGASTVTAEPEGVVISAPKISAAATGLHEIRGARVNLG